MRYLSVCSGIEAATVAWHGLGFEPVAFAEIEPFPSALLAHHYPTVPNLGDMTQINGKDLRGKIDLLVGGTPCQSFSVAGLRGGLEDARGNLSLVFMRLAHEARPEVVLWENVPGALSSNRGRDFGAIVGALEELGYGWAYRTLDAQYFGVPQRRRRVFLVGHLGGADRARDVLFEPEGLYGDPPPRPGQGQSPSAPTPPGAPVPSVLKMRAGCPGGGKGALIGEDQSFTLAATQDQTLFAPGAGAPVPLYYSHDYNQDRVYGVDGPAEARTVARNPNYLIPSPLGAQDNGLGVAYALNAHGGSSGRLDGESETFIPSPMGVRRLTPRECERLQGFPDDYTLIPFRGKPVTDGHRYKALGNSMAVPVMRWIGERIKALV